MSIKLALPKGRFLSPTVNLLRRVGLGFSDYGGETRQYRLQSANFPYLSAKIFQEKDIPIQVAVGNYDLGICGLDWIEELLVRYPASALVKVSSLGYGEDNVHVVVSNQAGISNLDELLVKQDDWRMVSEYPNLAEAFALNLRIRRFKIFPVWGAAEVYPPENADLAILSGRDDTGLEAQGLVSLVKLLPVTAFLIANRESLENKDLSPILSCLSSKLATEAQASSSVIASQGRNDSVVAYSQWRAKEIKLALPDGHQQPPASQFLKKAGLNLQGYSSRAWKRRPSVDLDWLGVKVIRPQDMPLQVANGNFDLAITGKDWVLEHLYRFPLSPVRELLALGFGGVKIVAAVSQDIPASNIEELGLLVRRGKFAPLRVASEYVNIADRYLRDNYVSPYRLIPTWGASEAFLPEDADLLIDNTQTGATLAQHNLKTIDVLFQSTACLIGNKDSLDLPDKKEKMEFFEQILRARLQ
ncbi:MAG: ATP phosphoribosyltransferase [Dehalococcoidia bacterium]|nr:ATP phosphoribosyltransferase [Dehalococcoidia bacterium]